MKIKFISIYIFNAMILFSLSGCERGELFKSEKSIEEELKGSWNLLPIPRTANIEVWNYSDGKIYFERFAGSAEKDTADYTIKTSIAKVEMDVKNFRIAPQYNIKWQIVTINSKYLVIAGEDANGGVLQKDFRKAD